MEETSHKSIMSVRDMTFTAIMTVLIAVCSWISLPIGNVPFTLQTFGVFCAVMLLGGRRGFFATAVYILLGTVGVPVFAGFTGGVGIIFGSTGGYILGFLLLAGIYWLAEVLLRDAFVFPAQIAALLFGTLVCYAFGTAWFIKVYSAAQPIDLKTALSWCVIPFIIPDCVKLALASVISSRLKKYVRI